MGANVREQNQENKRTVAIKDERRGEKSDEKEREGRTEGEGTGAMYI